MSASGPVEDVLADLAAVLACELPEGGDVSGLVVRLGEWSNWAKAHYEELMAGIDNGRIFDVDPDELTDVERELLNSVGSTEAALRLAHIACAAMLGDLIHTGGFEVVGSYVELGGPQGADLN